MKNEKDLKTISELLSTLKTNIELNNSIYYNDINKSAEDIICELLNLTFNYNLKNLNTNLQVPHVDLGN